MLFSHIKQEAGVNLKNLIMRASDKKHHSPKILLLHFCILLNSSDRFLKDISQICHLQLPVILTGIMLSGTWRKVLCYNIYVVNEHKESAVTLDNDWRTSVVLYCLVSVSNRSLSPMPCLMHGTVQQKPNFYSIFIISLKFFIQHCRGVLLKQKNGLNKF